MNARLDQASRLIEIERAQIGHEIHDALLPLIFAASASIGRMIDDSDSDPESIASDQQQRLTQIASWLDEAMQTGRRLLTQVYPPELAAQNWTATAAADIERLLGDQHSIVSWDVDPQINRIEQHLALAAYRIVIEAIRNAIRHGNATNVSVRGSKVADHWQIEVSDNGSGFDATNIPSDRFGIRSMIGRAELAGGTLNIHSKPGGPTTIAFRFPCDRS